MYVFIYLFNLYAAQIKLRREQKKVEGKAGIKAILQHSDPFPPTLAEPHLDFLNLD